MNEQQHPADTNTATAPASPVEHTVRAGSLGEQPVATALTVRLWLIGQLAAGYANNKSIAGGELGGLRIAVHAAMTANEILDYLSKEREIEKTVAAGTDPKRGRRRR